MYFKNKGNERICMNILLVTGAFTQSPRDTALGGMARAVFRHAYELQKRGNYVRILCAGNITKKWFYEGIEVYSIEAVFNERLSNYRTILEILRREFLFQKKILELNRDKRIDVIQYTGWFGVGLFHFSNIPAVMRISSYTRQQLSTNYSWTKKHIFSIFEKMALKRMNVVFAPSRIMAQAVSRDMKKPVGVLETPYAPPQIKEDTKIIDTRLKDIPYLLFIGRRSKDKGIYEIIGILQELLNTHKELFFVFAGDAENLATKKQILAEAGQYHDRVIFLGLLQQEKLFPVIRNARAVVMPSLQDNFPNSCAEAMSIGQIVIGTDGSSIEQFITHEESGFLCKIGDKKDLLKTINRVLLLKEVERKQISECAIKRIEELNPSDYIQKLMKLYKHVIEMKKQ